MAQSKSSFVLYADMAQHIALLSDEQAGQLFKGLFAFCSNGNTPTFADGITTMAFSFISAQIERDAQKYNETCAKRSAAGKKGGRPRKINSLLEKQSKAKKANGFFENQTKAKKGDTDTDTDNENDTVNDILSELSPELKVAVNDWKMYKKQKRCKLQPLEERAFATKLKDYSTQYGEKAVKNEVYKAIANGYRGVIWGNLEKHKPQQIRLDIRPEERGDNPL